jgi:hypothetical protein
LEDGMNDCLWLRNETWKFSSEFCTFKVLYYFIIRREIFIFCVCVYVLFAFIFIYIFIFMYIYLFIYISIRKKLLHVSPLIIIISVTKPSTFVNH